MQWHVSVIQLPWVHVALLPSTMVCVYLYSVCVWREVYTWVCAWCKEHENRLTRVSTCVNGQF